MSPEELVDRLRSRLRDEERLIVAYSGGIDSALLAKVGTEELGGRCLAATAVSASLPRSERLAARAFARRHEIQHVEVCTDEGDRPEYVVNGGDRCYHCKSALFDALTPLAAMLGAPVALGTIVDDLGDHRPGQRAARERGVIAPLADSGFTKEGVRRACRLLGLDVAEKPASACLASRVAYGDPVTPDVLGRVEVAEAALRDLGFAVCRVRAHADGTIGRVEVPEDQFENAVAVREQIDSAVRGAGFLFCALDLAGFQSGRLNALLPLTVVRAG